MPNSTSSQPAFHQKKVLRACAEILDRIEANPAYERTSGLLVEVGGEVRFAVDRRGPAVADVFSVTKAVTATLVGIAQADGFVPDLDAPAKPSPHTWRQLLTMTRGSETDGAWELDAVMARADSWLEHWLAAPAVTDPGKKFRYDDGAYHLLGAALAEATRRPLAEYAAERLFGPLGIEEWAWLTDPEGLPLGFGHLQLDRPALATFGRLWLDQGRLDGQELLPAKYARAMATAHTTGGAPEWKGYGFGLWVDKSMGFFASGWAGQHVLVLPAADAVIVTTGYAAFDPGPPPTDEMPEGWRPAVKLVREVLVPVLLAGGSS
ncbi:serine hydrolase domain-containing protein [Sporichthya polymorpha]|uniref:serine hydrolase domain-containing protein n=1 Tax=Sporichthya polymorpha TaxID=35751 RepID=UPI0012EB444D|nr:serine hydrolase [Sporichthya polymorpha]